MKPKTLALVVAMAALAGPGATPAEANTLTCAKARWVIPHAPRHVPARYWRGRACVRFSAHRVRVGAVRVRLRHRSWLEFWKPNVYDLSWPGCGCPAV